jgi:hypothetical protein
MAEDEDGKFAGDSPKKGPKKPKATDRKLAEDDDDTEKLLKLPEGTVDMATVTKRFKALFRKQEQLLVVCLSVLRNLAENLDTERKMLKRKLVMFLVPLLSRENEELLALSAEFLRKIAMNAENLQAIVSENAVVAAMALANHGSDNVEKVSVALFVLSPVLDGLQCVVWRVGVDVRARYGCCSICPLINPSHRPWSHDSSSAAWWIN